MKGITKLTNLMREAKAAHTLYDADMPEHDWERFYAAYIAHRMNGSTVLNSRTLARLEIERIYGNDIPK